MHHKVTFTSLDNPTSVSLSMSMLTNEEKRETSNSRYLREDKWEKEKTNFKKLMGEAPSANSCVFVASIISGTLEESTGTNYEQHLPGSPCLKLEDISEPFTIRACSICMYS